MKEKFKLTALEKSWIGYDIGNSAFILLVTAIVPIYFNALTDAAGLTESQYFSYWGIATSIATLLVAFIGPICGTLADYKGFKKPLFTLCVMLGVLGCAALGAAHSWLSFLVIFVIAKVGFNSSLIFYDAMLPEVTDDKRMDNVSATGYALGYIGSVIPFIVCLVLVLFAGSFGISTGTAMAIAFLITAGWWVLLTLPLLKRYRQVSFVEPEAHPFVDSFRRLGTTLGKVKQEKHIFLYLLAFFFFIDGVYTIISMATTYGQSLGLDSTGLLLALLVTQIVAFPFSILFGRLSAKYDTGLLIKVCIIAYTCVVMFAVFMVSQWQFWLLAVMVGMF
ncbi:MAG: MFS transporter, partial [Candidatus Faecousia sp.]|nr:MFS transporter [Candidatus Faecousia sp.]